MLRNILTCLVFCALCTASRLHAEPVIYGSYIEVQADSKTAALPGGFGFGLASKASANRTAGSHRAILFWEIVKGSWNGQELDSLKIVTVVESSGPLRSPRRGNFERLSTLMKKLQRKKPRHCSISHVNSPHAT